MMFDAPRFARAWLSVAQASTTDRDSYLLDRTVAIEVFPTGVRFVATDRYVLLTAWVADLSSKHPREPELYEMPDRTVICKDSDSRAKSLLKYVRVLAKRDSLDELPEGHMALALTFDERLPAGAAGNPDTLEGLESLYVILSIPDVEKVYVPIVQANYPDFRPVLLDHSPVDTKQVALDPERLHRLAGLRSYCEGVITWTFGGSTRVALIDMPESDPRVRGMVMPSRWALEGEDTTTQPANDDDDDGNPEANVTPIGVDLTDTSGESLVPASDDDLLARAAELVITTQFGSVAMLIRKLSVGLARANRLMDTLEGLGHVGPAAPGKTREVITRAEDLQTTLSDIRNIQK